MTGQKAPNGSLGQKNHQFRLSEDDEELLRKLQSTQDWSAPQVLRKALRKYASEIGLVEGDPDERAKTDEKYEEEEDGRKRMGGRAKGTIQKQRVAGKKQTYRFAGVWTPDIGEELEWLCARMTVSKNNVVEQAIHEMYERMRSYTLVLSLEEEHKTKKQEGVYV